MKSTCAHRLVLLGVLATMAACRRSSVETAPVLMTWSIDGEDTPIRCAQHGAALVEIVVSKPTGEPVQSASHQCFVAQAIDTLDRRYIAEGLALKLPRGEDYVATARLKDKAGQPITADVTARFTAGVAGQEPNFEFGGQFSNGT